MISKAKTYKPIKPFLTYDQQIEHLQKDKKLIINDVDSAKDALANISYYALIGGYKTLFYDPMTRTYLPGTTFDDILTLYLFDEKLRHLVFEYSNIIEQKLRSSISYAFCVARNSNRQNEYLNPANYQNTKKNRYNIGKLLHILKYIAFNNPEGYLVYQRNTYGNVPLYAVIKALTFGQLSVMFSLVVQNIQIPVSRSFSTSHTSMSVNDLIMYLQVLTHFRNRCAHIERLFSYNDLHDIPDTALHKKMGIPQKGTQYICGKHDLFAIVIAYRYLLPKDDFKEFKKELTKLIDKTVRKASTLTEEKLLKAMGFPENWKKITMYLV